MEPPTVVGHLGSLGHLAFGDSQVGPGSVGCVVLVILGIFALLGGGQDDR